MTFRKLIGRSLRFHIRAHLGVCLGAVIGSAALVGALVVGDSMRESLRQQALTRVGNTWFALAPADRLFTAELAQRLDASGRPNRISSYAPTTTLLALPGIASRPGGEARANQVQIYGVVHGSNGIGVGELNISPGTVWLNGALAAQLQAKPGEEVLLRLSRNEQLSTDSPLAPRNEPGFALTLKVGGILAPNSGGDLNLRSSGLPAMNAFVRADDIWASSDFKGKANLLLVGAPYQAGRGGSRTDEALKHLNEALQLSWTIEDAGLKVQSTPGMGFELRSARVFLEPQIVTAAEKRATTNAVPISTYLANLLVAGTNSTPYSMVTAAGPPYTPAGLEADQIVLNSWLAEDLRVKAGDHVSFVYFDPESGAKLVERTNVFRVHSIVPMEVPWADKSLMPDFPGIEKAENPRDWDAGFPLVHKIRPKDEDYWKKYKGTPKAFITLGAGEKMWANRFGALTAVRVPDSSFADAEIRRKGFAEKLLATVTPEQLGFRFEPVRAQALKSAEQSQDFGGLFLGFSFFVVLSSLLLMGLLFQFALEQRASEIGTLLALGFTSRQVRRLLLLEGAVLAFIGAILGVLGGLGYARGMVLALTTIWRNAIGASALSFHFTLTSLLIGLLAGTLVACFTIWLTLRKQARQPAQELLARKIQTAKAASRWHSIGLAIAAGGSALILVGWALWKQDTANAGVFFGAGSLLLVSGLALSAAFLATLERRVSAKPLTFEGLALRNCARRRKRSLMTMALLASGCFVISAISAFRLDASREAGRLDSGTGGFVLLGQSALPVAQELNSQSGRDAFGLSAEDLARVNIVPMRVREGDEASCLNLSRAQKPRVLGVNPDLLKNRFTFTKAAPGLDIGEKWNLLKVGAERASGLADEIPAVGDANSIQWALGRKIGDTLDYVDDQGRAFKVRLVGAVANSILQGNLLIDEAQFVRRFPSQSGYQFFLIDAQSNRVSEVSRLLSRALQDKGFELTSSVERLDAFNAVQNTYLGTFQILGGLGLLLGSAGLGVVVLRNVLERRGELGLLLAVGFRRGRLQKLILAEHGALLGVGLAIGIGSAAVAVLPALVSPEGHLPYASLATTLTAVLLNGAFWTWVAIGWAVRGDLLQSLRNE